MIFRCISCVFVLSFLLPLFSLGDDQPVAPDCYEMYLSWKHATANCIGRVDFDGNSQGFESGEGEREFISEFEGCDEFPEDLHEYRITVTMDEDFEFFTAEIVVISCPEVPSCQASMSIVSTFVANLHEEDCEDKYEHDSGWVGNNVHLGQDHSFWCHWAVWPLCSPVSPSSLSSCASRCTPGTLTPTDVKWSPEYDEVCSVDDGPLTGCLSWDEEHETWRCEVEGNDGHSWEIFVHLFDNSHAEDEWGCEVFLLDGCPNEPQCDPYWWCGERALPQNVPCWTSCGPATWEASPEGDNSLLQVYFHHE